MNDHIPVSIPCSVIEQDAKHSQHLRTDTKEDYFFV